MAQDGVEPRAGRALSRIEASGPPPDLHEGVLHGLFGERRPAQEAQGHAEHARRFGIINGPQGHAVAPRAGPQRVIEVGALRTLLFDLRSQGRLRRHSYTSCPALDAGLKNRFSTPRPKMRLSWASPCGVEGSV